MGGSKSYDLTDTWSGRFAYPGRYDPVSFVARLDHAGDWLSGTVEEPGMRSGAGRMLTATVSGKVTGDAVSFLKLYDAPTRGYDAVQYVGAVRDEGLEIAGTWTIHAGWSGTFIMIRSRGLMLGARRGQFEKV